jgi:hypothetical protein
MPRGGFRQGAGTTSKARALQTLKRELQFLESATAGLVPRERDFEAWCRAMSALLCMRTVGLLHIRYADQSLEKARAFWVKPNQQLVINALAELSIKAKERRDERIADQAQRRLVKHITKKAAETSVPAAQAAAAVVETKKAEAAKAKSSLDEMAELLDALEKAKALVDAPTPAVAAAEPKCDPAAQKSLEDLSAVLDRQEEQNA